MREPVSPEDGREARENLLQIAGRRTQPIPAEFIVDHVLALPGPWDWPVRREALEAILRRLSSVRTQEIAVVEAPGKGPWGRYELTRADADNTLPYDVRLWSLSPLRGACNCADFTRAALGICKHLAALVTNLARRARLFQRFVATPSSSFPRLLWDPTDSAGGLSDVLGALRFSTPKAAAHGSEHERAGLAQ